MGFCRWFAAVKEYSSSSMKLHVCISMLGVFVVGGGGGSGFFSFFRFFLGVLDILQDEHSVDIRCVIADLFC